MATITNNLTVYRGGDYTLPCTVTPVTNISGWTIVLTIKSVQGRGAVVLSIPVTIVSAAAGTFTVPFTHAQLLIPPGTYSYDIHRTDSGSATVLSIGDFVVLPEVLY